jgi:fatty-acyl-CoA synthase
MLLTEHEAPQVLTAASTSPAKAWLRALDLTSSIAANPWRLLSTIIEESARENGLAPALLSDNEQMTYRELSSRANQYTRWALAQGLGKEDTVCLMMPNRPEYLAIWLGICRTGCTVALLNTSLTGPSLAHSVNIVAPRHIIVATPYIDNLARALNGSSEATIWAWGWNDGAFDRIDIHVERHSGRTLRCDERLPVTIRDRALCIYTSGTTGLPKAANISHARILQWSYWFAGLMGNRPSDRLYNCLPMYHSVGGVLATGAFLVAGGSVVLRDKFSASRFWSDIVRYDCTAFQYIGELCRYLLHTPTAAGEAQHRIRICCGNGLRPDIWEGFKSRFHIPQILEFYAATEGNVSLFNVEGKPGAIGRIPSYLAHRFPASLVQFELDKEEPLRNADGFCIPAAPNETGEALGRIFEDPSNVGNRFEGYTSDEASSRKILRDVFEPGDAWFRTGDLMRRDKQGYFYFVDRIGDTFRWKGENVATSEVAEAICCFPGVTQASVYGVCLPGCEGRAGMAAIATDHEVNLAAFLEHLRTRLPEYAQPLFLRIQRELAVTTTLKVTKTRLVQEGYDPSGTRDSIYFNDRRRGAFVPLDQPLYQAIHRGQIRV